MSLLYGVTGDCGHDTIYVIHDGPTSDICVCGICNTSSTRPKQAA